MKRILSLLLVITLFCTLSAPASAAVSDPIQPRFNYINSTIVSFRVDDNTGIAYCYATCEANSGVTIKIVGALQQYKNGGWSNVISWSKSGAELVVLNKQRAVYSGYQYRFLVKFYIYNSAGTLLETDVISRSDVYA